MSMRSEIPICVPPRLFDVAFEKFVRKQRCNILPNYRLEGITFSPLRPSLLTRQPEKVESDSRSHNVLQANRITSPRKPYKAGNPKEVRRGAEGGGGWTGGGRGLKLKARHRDSAFFFSLPLSKNKNKKTCLFFFLLSSSCFLLFFFFSFFVCFALIFKA